MKPDPARTPFVSFTQPASCTLLETNGDERLFSVSVPGYTGSTLRLVVLGIHWLQFIPAS